MHAFDPGSQRLASLPMTVNLDRIMGKAYNLSPDLTPPAS